MRVGPFRLSLSTAFKNQCRQLWARARRGGQLAEFIATIEAVNQILQSNPDDWGDPLFHYRQLRLEMRQGIRDGYWFYYGVHADQPAVFLEQIQRIVDPDD